MRKSVDEIMESYTPEVGDLITKHISGEEMTCEVLSANEREVVYTCMDKKYIDPFDCFVRRVKHTVRNGASFFRVQTPVDASESGMV